jgi:hypothetical protein
MPEDLTTFIDEQVPNRVKEGCHWKTEGLTWERTGTGV